jgi:hypothetical protein
MLTGGVGGKFGNGAQRTQRKNSKIYQGQPIEHFILKKTSNNIQYVEVLAKTTYLQFGLFICPVEMFWLGCNKNRICCALTNETREKIFLSFIIHNDLF